MTTQRPAKKTASKKETAKKETAAVPKNRYGNSRALLVVPSRDRSRCKTLTPWAEVDELDRGIMWAEATRMTDSARKKLRYKAPTGREYADIMRLRFGVDLAPRTARQLFASKEAIVVRWRDCVRQQHSRRTKKYLARCAEQGVQPGALAGVDFPGYA